MQQPKLRLRHLLSIQACNLAAGTANTHVHYELWSRGVSSGQDWPLLHVSEQVLAAPGSLMGVIACKVIQHNAL